MTTRTKALLAVLVVGVVVAGAALWWYFDDDAPDEVSLERAVGSVDTSTPAADGTAPAAGGDAGTADPTGPDGISGTWTVDAEHGDFDFDTATGSFVGFRVVEELVSIGTTEAVGRSGEVVGSMTIEGTTLAAATIEVDLTAIRTNESRRDGRVQGSLETDRFPTATFVLSAPVELPADAGSGAPVTVTATGDLTVHGVTNEVALPLEAQLVEGTIVVVGSLDVVFADYGVSVPSAPVVVSAEDHGVMELQLLWIRG